MFDFNKHHEQVYADNPQHKATWSHELIAGAAAFEAMKAYQSKHPEGKHKLSKEVLASLAGAELDKLFENKGLNFLDRKKAEHETRKKAEELYDQQVAAGDIYT
ncbi:hypothetical protein BGX28_007128 [Mortierella sp. GBA30]|nr:hypothetical protein BGX28_007128 [Mortierella sp. GBA30]